METSTYESGGDATGVQTLSPGVISVNTFSKAA